MKSIIFVFISLVSLIPFSSTPVNADSEIYEDSLPRISYCNNEGECGLYVGIESIFGRIQGLVYDRPFSVWIQDVVKYLFTFLTLIAVIYIMYAGFNLLVGNGNEEKLKKTKNIILYVIGGIVLIWLAYPIVTRVFKLFG